MRAGYGDKLRRYVQRHRIEGISDFGNLPVFEEATTYPGILELSRAEARAGFPAARGLQGSKVARAQKCGAERVSHLSLASDQRTGIL